MVAEGCEVGVAGGGAAVQPRVGGVVAGGALVRARPAAPAAALARPRPRPEAVRGPVPRHCQPTRLCLLVLGVGARAVHQVELHAGDG